MVSFFDALRPLVFQIIVCPNPLLVSRSTIARNLGLLVGVEHGGCAQVLSSTPRHEKHDTSVTLVGGLVGKIYC